jgi:hypothetical protein
MIDSSRHFLSVPTIEKVRNPPVLNAWRFSLMMRTDHMLPRQARDKQKKQRERHRGVCSQAITAMAISKMNVLHFHIVDGDGWCGETVSCFVPPPHIF